MFTGIVKAMAKVTLIIKESKGKVLEFILKDTSEIFSVGDSIAINGCCTSITTIHNNCLKVYLVNETLTKTNLDLLKVNDFINIEYSLKANASIHGHIVQGHVEATGEIIAIKDSSMATTIITVQYPAILDPYIVNKGYITVDGMSLTVITAKNNCFCFTLIPLTQALTIAKYYCIGTIVNLETDIFAKYFVKTMEKNYADLIR